MKITQLCFCIFLGAACFTFTSCSHKTVPAASKQPAPANNNNVASENGIDTANLQQDILARINQYRQSKGLSSLQLLDAANVQAIKHSNNMAMKFTPFGHNGFEGRVSAISKVLGAPVSAAAENVAVGRLTAKQVVDGWLHSPGHKKNIEGNYTHTGIGFKADYGGIIYFTQIFLHK